VTHITDIFTKAKRSEVMSLIRGKGNKRTEGALIKIFKEQGIKGWRRHLKLPGKPDFTFRKERVTVFVDGCFWRGCPRCYRAPKGNRKFWEAKITRNRERDRERDREVNRELRKRGWCVLRIAEHSLRKKDHKRLLSRIEKALSLQ
jgi:DNA mismatch endonuclease (patch repair protein)